MIYRDYTKEVGLRSGERKIPWPVAVLVLALFAAGLGWFASVELHRSVHPLHKDSGAFVANVRPVNPATAGRLSNALPNSGKHNAS